MSTALLLLLDAGAGLARLAALAFILAADALDQRKPEPRR